MSDEAIKEARATMRQVHEHLLQAHLHLGAESETVGFVDVIHHASNPAAHLNYITPRRNTAWVSSKHIETGLDHMRKLERRPRVQIAEGLFPPMFIKTLRDLGLEAEREVPIMIYRASSPPQKRPRTPGEIKITQVDAAESAAIWWYVWRNAYYDVICSGIEPVYVGRDLRDITSGRLINLILYRYGFPVGAARITRHENSAHVAAMALMREVRTAEITRQFQHAVLRAALDAGSELVFTAGETDETRKLWREMAFVDAGSIVSYAEPSESTPEESHVPVEQPVLVW